MIDFWVMSQPIPIHVEYMCLEEIYLVEENRGFSLRKSLGGRGSTNYEFSTSNPLWRATFDVIDFMPLVTVDYSGGMIITDWYTSEKKPSERFKITVLVLSQAIRSDSVKVTVHRQIIKQNRWVNKNIDSVKPIAIERKIIQRAIELNL